MSAADNRLALMKQMLALTREMQQRSEEPEFLIQSVEKRQQLMEEIDEIKQQYQTQGLADDPQQMNHMKEIARDIMDMDEGISRALSKHYQESKKHLSSSNNQQRILGYVNNAISSSGSYMDYRK